MCSAPQPHTIFWHRNFKKWPERVSFLAFWLANVLRATASCNFSTAELQKVLPGRHSFNILTWNVLLTTAVCNFSTSELLKAVRRWRVLYIFTYQCASRHSGVQFFTSPLTTWLRPRRFNEPTFRLTRHTNHSKNKTFPDFPNIWRGWIVFFLLTFAHCIFFLLTLQSATPYYVHWTTPYCKELLRTTQFYNVLLRTTKY